MGLGVPVVATRTAGSVELLDDGRCGILTEHDDEAVYRGIKLLVDDEKFETKICRKGKLRVLAILLLIKLCSKYISCLIKILNFYLYKNGSCMFYR